MARGDIRTIEERRKQNHDQTIIDILLIAREMMQADGVAALSFNAIARRLGIKPPSLYTYFDSKHAIYDALFRLGFETFIQHMGQHTDREHGVEQYVRSMIEAYMTFALENPDLFQLMFQRPVPGFTPSEASMAVSLHALDQGRLALQATLKQSNVKTTISVEEASDLIIATMHGLTELQLANNPESPVGEGRFGSLVVGAVQMFMQAWTIRDIQEDS
jgi:AcrR family transcriptional regulator